MTVPSFHRQGNVLNIPDAWAVSSWSFTCLVEATQPIQFCTGSRHRIARIVLAVFGTLPTGLTPIGCALLCPHVWLHLGAWINFLSQCLLQLLASSETTKQLEMWLIVVGLCRIDARRRFSTKWKSACLDYNSKSSKMRDNHM